MVRLEVSDFRWDRRLAGRFPDRRDAGPTGQIQPDHVSKIGSGARGISDGGSAGTREGVGDGMNRSLVDNLVNAVLYEGYILYPYRPSIKNRQRWTFGGIYAEAYCQTQRGGDASVIQTECLARGEASTKVDAVVRFLHLTERQVGEVVPSSDPCPAGGEPSWRPVDMLRVGEKTFHTWQEAEERQAALGEATLG